MNRSNQHHDQTADNDAKTDERIARVIVLNSLLLTGFTILFLTVTSCQQAVQMQDATIPLQVVEGAADD